MTVGLYLMTEKGLAVLNAALDSGVRISHVTTAPAAGMNDQSDETIAAMCKAYGIPVFLRAAPPTFRADWSIAAGWRWMLGVPNLIVLHDSLLPRYRGFSPLVTALVNGESQVGVTAFLAEAEPDTGPVVCQRAVPVAYPARMREVLDRVTPVYGELAAEVCGTLARDETVTYAAQDHSQATYSVWRDDQDFRIDWARDDRRVCRLVDAASDPFSGAWTMSDRQRLTVHAATVEPDVRIEDRQPGKVAFLRDGCPVVVCGTGLVRVTDMRIDTEPVSLALKTRLA